MPYFILLIFSIILSAASAQNVHNIVNFNKSKSISVKAGENILDNAWAGGMNCPQFSKMKINKDTLYDLFVYDRSSEKSAFYIAIKEQDTIRYQYLDVPSDFPVLQHWALITDYNKDGNDDIFTYQNGGIKVFRNISQNNFFKFVLEKEMLLSDYGTGVSLNIYVNEADIPAISDIDGDGDVDVLSFHILGNYVQYHKNISMEKYGHCDSLEFSLEENCWGNFSESESNNIIHKNILCPLDKDFEDHKRHTGSTLLAVDLDQDSDRDLLLGDVDFRGLSALYNGGNKDSAIIISSDSLFPTQNPLNITSMPAAFDFDYNADGIDDLLIAPNDPNKSINRNNVFALSKTNKRSEYKLIRTNFLCSSMIDVGMGAYPTFFDYNNDGLMDLVVGNYGVLRSSKDSIGTIFSTYVSGLSLFKNIGTLKNPEFEFVDSNYLKLDSLHEQALTPFFYDMNQDQLPDLICGNEKGQFLFFENQGLKNGSFGFQISSKNYMNIDVGKNSSPILFDLNKDLKPDIISGAKDGKIYFFENTGTTESPYFQNTPSISSLGNIDVVNHNTSYYGYSMPQIITTAQDTLFLCGSEQGLTFVYNGVNSNNQKFKLMDSLITGLKPHIRNAISCFDINSDGYMDLIEGNWGGGLNYYEGSKPYPLGIDEAKEKIDIKLFPNPASDKLYIEASFNYSYWIYDALGKELLHGKKSESTNEISVSDLDRGVYFIRITNNSGNYTVLKFIK